MKNRGLIVIIFVSILVTLLVAIWALTKSPKIAYVRSQDLVYGYFGMKEAQNKFKNQSQLWEANVDTLKSDFQKSVSRYQEEFKGLSDEEKTKRQNLLQSEESNLIQYTNAVNKKAKEEEDKMLEGVLNQVNSFVESYGKEKGYDIILGTTLSGSVLYGRDAIDITQQVLDELNNQYKGSATKK